MTDTVDRTSAVPLYQQLDDLFTAKMARGEWPAGQRIPSEVELHRHYGLSRMTVRGALDKLVADGLLERVPGKGTFVVHEKIDAVSPAYQGIREQLEVRGYAIATELVSLERRVAPTRVRDRLGLAEDAEVFAIVRRRTVDGDPLSVHRSFVPAALAPTLDELDVVGEQLCVVLEDAFGLAMRDVAEGLEAVAVQDADATLLGLHRGEPVLQLTDVLADRLGTRFEYSTVVFRGDRVRLQFDYRRP